MKFRDASEVLEIQRLKLLISEMKEKGSKIEAQLLAKKKEKENGNGNGITVHSMLNKQEKQERSYMENNRKEMNKLDDHIKKLHLKIGALQNEIDNMVKGISEKHRNQMELATIREKIKQLQDHIKNDASDTKAELLTLKKQLKRLEEGEKVNNEKEAEYERTVAVLRNLDSELASLKQDNNELLQYNNESRRKLADIQNWIAEKNDVMAEVSKLQSVNQDLSKKVEELQNNRFNEVEELVYLKWVNTCLRHELDVYKASKRTPESFMNHVKESNDQLDVRYNDVNTPGSSSSELDSKFSISDELHDGSERLHTDENVTYLPDSSNKGNMLKYNGNRDHNRPVKIISVPRFTHLHNKRESALSSQLSRHSRSASYKATDSNLIGKVIQGTANQSILKENNNQKSSFIAVKSQVSSPKKVSFRHLDVSTDQMKKGIDKDEVKYRKSFSISDLGHSHNDRSLKPASRSITLLDDYIQSITTNNLSKGSQSSRSFDSQQSPMNQKYNFFPMHEHASNRAYSFNGRTDSTDNSASKLVSEHSSKFNMKSEEKNQSTYLHRDIYEASKTGQELLMLEWHQRRDDEDMSSKSREEKPQFRSPSSKADFIGDLAEAIQKKVYKCIDDVTVFIEWLDRQADKEEFLAYSRWPAKKIDAMRMAVDMHEELKSLESELAGFRADVDTPPDALLKDVVDLLQRAEKSIHDFVNTREKTAAQLEKYKIPQNWMLDSGVIEKIKQGSMQVTRQYIEIVKDTILQDHELIQATRLLIRVHHFTGGMDEETLNAFMELQNRQGLRPKVKQNIFHEWNVQKNGQGLVK